MGWRGAAVLRRNAAVALGNGLDRADVPALTARWTRIRTRWSARTRPGRSGRMRLPARVAAFAGVDGTEDDASVRAEIVAALGTLNASTAVP